MASPLSRFLANAFMPSDVKNFDRLSTSGCVFKTSDSIVEPQRPVERTSAGAMRFVSMFQHPFYANACRARET